MQSKPEAIQTIEQHQIQLFQIRFKGQTARLQEQQNTIRVSLYSLHEHRKTAGAPPRRRFLN